MRWNVQKRDERHIGGRVRGERNKDTQRERERERERERDQPVISHSLYTSMGVSTTVWRVMEKAPKLTTLGGNPEFTSIFTLLACLRMKT